MVCAYKRDVPDNEKIRYYCTCTYILLCVCVPADDQSADLRIPFLSYSEGMHLTAYICSVSSPSTFIAQPYGSQLVNFMHELR